MLKTLFTYIIVITTIIFAGCPESSEEDIRPRITKLPDETLTVGDEVKKTVTIKNAVLEGIDVEITSEDTRVATVIVNSVYNQDDLPSVRISATRDPAFNFTSAASNEVGTEIETTFTIKAVAVGKTTLTIYATNDTRNDNADALPVSFHVTVKAASL